MRRGGYVKQGPRFSIRMVIGIFCSDTDNAQKKGFFLGWLPLQDIDKVNTQISIYVENTFSDKRFFLKKHLIL